MASTDTVPGEPAIALRVAAKIGDHLAIVRQLARIGQNNPTTDLADRLQRCRNVGGKRVIARPDLAAKRHLVDVVAAFHFQTRLCRISG